jgi:glycine cleavage system regulatory protein
MTDLVLTLIGSDRPGLVEAVAGIIAAHGGNWLESRMTHLAGKFAGILRAELPRERAAAALQALAGLESRGLRVVAEATPREAPGGGAEARAITTDRQSAPMSGEMLFVARAHVHVPAGTDVGVLRAALERVASDLVVEIKLEERRATR